MEKSDRDRVIRLARAQGFITARKVSEAGIHSSQLTRLVADDTLQRVARGHYRLTDTDVTEHHALALASLVAPRGVICLLSALAFHGIGTQLPAGVWIAIERGDRAPKLADLELRVVRYSGAAFHEGIEEHDIEGRRVRVYGVAKTIADLFKARNQVGVDVAIEALREAWRDRRFAMADLDHAARICRVDRIMRPYIEAIVA
jgi:predicted transcriptional regulator of viral defense system